MKATITIKLFTVLFLFLLFSSPVISQTDNHWNVEQLASRDYWENSTDMFVSGDFVYFAADVAGLQIVDITDPLNPFKIGSLDLEGKTEKIIVSGNYAYATIQSSGVTILDISNPTNPIEVGFFQLENHISDIEVSESFVYLLDDESNSVIAVDVSSPENPVEVWTYETGSYTKSLNINNDHIYVCGYWQGVYIIDISDASNPDFQDYYELEYSLGEMVFAGEIAYSISNGGVRILDISNPVAPVEAGFIENPYEDWIQNIAIDDDNLYVEYFIPCVASSLVTYNISNPTNPNEEGYFYTDWALGKLIPIDGYLLGLHIDGLTVLELSNPSNPECVSGLYTDEKVINVTISGNYAFLSDKYYGLRIIDFSDPTTLHETSLFEIDEVINNIAVSGDYAYAALNLSGLQIIDISNPNTPTGMGVYETPSTAIDIAVSGDFAYVATSALGLCVVDISDPVNPIEEAICPVQGSGRALAISGEYAYLACSTSGLRIVDISNPSFPFVIGVYDSLCVALDVAVAGDYAYVSLHFADLLILNVSDPRNIFEVCRYAGLRGPKDLKVSGDYLISTSCGISVTDISDPYNPYEVGYYRTRGDALGVDISDDYVFLADGYHARLFDYSQVFNENIPVAFNLISPQDSTIYETNEVEFNWAESSDDVYEYLLCYSTSRTFSTNIDSFVVNQTSYTDSNFLENRRYYWKVLARNGTSSGRWSDETRTFIIENTAVDDNPENIPAEYAITKAYPNPFNPTLSVSISLPETANLIVTIHNIMGQRVATLADGSQYGAGIQNFTFDGSDLSSGVYFIRAVVPGKLNQIQKVVLMK